MARMDREELLATLQQDVERFQHRAETGYITAAHAASFRERAELLEWAENQERHAASRRMLAQRLKEMASIH